MLHREEIRQRERECWDERISERGWDLTRAGGRELYKAMGEGRSNGKPNL